MLLHPLLFNDYYLSNNLCQIQTAPQSTTGLMWNLMVQIHLLTKRCGFNILNGTEQRKCKDACVLRGANMFPAGSG